MRRRRERGQRGGFITQLNYLGETTPTTHRMVVGSFLQKEELEASRPLNDFRPFGTFAKSTRYIFPKLAFAVSDM
jgi:hypothetical protein